MPVLRDWNLAVDADKVLWGQGADPAVIRARRPRLARIAERVIEEGRGLLAPALLYDSFDVLGLRHERLDLAGGGSLAGPLIARQLGRAARVVVAVCTVGGGLSRYASEVSQTDPVRSLALDGLASAAAQGLAESACQYFEAQAAAGGLIASVPLNPGMVGWPLAAGQAQIFSLVSPQTIGVDLTVSGLMTPVKSLSFVVGFGHEADPDSCSCDYCTMRDTCRFTERQHARSI
jgi:hypothetical protein